MIMKYIIKGILFRITENLFYFYASYLNDANQRV